MRKLTHPKKGLSAFQNLVISKPKKVKGGTDSGIITEDTRVL